MKKCKLCGQENGNHKFSCSTNKITIMDITMCSGKGCNLANECYRYTAPKSKFGQSYFVEPPMDKDGKCEYYEKVRKNT